MISRPTGFSTARRRLILATLGALGLLLLASTASVDVLTLRFPHRNTAPITLARVAPGRQVVLAYTHSVEGTPVEGVFRVGPQRCFEMQQTRYTSVGTGLPTASASKPTREGEWFVVEEGNRKLESIRFFSVPENQVRLKVGATTLNIENYQARGLFELQIQPMSRMRWWWTAFAKPSLAVE